MVTNFSEILGSFISLKHVKLPLHFVNNLNTSYSYLQVTILLQGAWLGSRDPSKILYACIVCGIGQGRCFIFGKQID